MAGEETMDFMSMLEADVNEPVTSVSAAQSPSFEILQQYALELEQLKEEEDDMKARLKMVTGRVSELRLKLIPDLMQSLNMVDAAGRGNFTLPSGGRISLRTDFYAGIDKAREEEAFGWLRENGLGEIIRLTVNAQTLKAVLRERLEQGQEPPDMVKTYFETSAVLTRPKVA